MRSLLAILLIFVTGLPVFASLANVSSGSDANLPACCRRNGAHHCGMLRARMGESTGIRLKAPLQSCPYSSHALLTAQHAPAAPTRAASIFAGLVSHPAVAAQTLAKFRIARDRCRQKRGPPALA